MVSRSQAWNCHERTVLVLYKTKKVTFQYQKDFSFLFLLFLLTLPKALTKGRNLFALSRAPRDPRAPAPARRRDPATRRVGVERGSGVPQDRESAFWRD